MLTKAAGNFDTPETVKNVPFLVFCALAEGRITERRAGILCYLVQTLVHPHRAIALKKKDRKGLAADNLHPRPAATGFWRSWTMRAT
jgi:hypothetical protein